MKREKALKIQEKKLEDLIETIKMIKMIPKNVPVVFQAHVWVMEGNNNYRIVPSAVAGRVIEFNAESVKVELMASKKKTISFRNIDSVVPLKFKSIESWKPLPKEDLPLLIGWDQVFQPLEDALKAT